MRLGLGAAPLGECSGAGVRNSEDGGNLGVLGVSSSPESRRSRARSGYGQGCWGELRGTLGS